MVEKDIRGLVIKIFILVLVSFVTLSAQIVYEPLFHKDIYVYLNRLSNKGIINLHDEIRPISRKQIGSFLIQADNEQMNLSQLERNELGFYKQEYAFEINKLKSQPDIDTLTVFGFDDSRRFRSLKYSNMIFNINADPILGASISSSNEIYYHRWNGVRIWGYLTDYIGYSFDFRDNLEEYKNKNIKRTLPFSKIPGRKLMQGNSDSHQFSEVHAMISGSWAWGSLSIGKDYINIGNGYDGQIILSSKAPSFTFIRLDITPAHWFKFTYLHGWLNSGLIDSSSIKLSLVKNVRFSKTYDRRQKYLASHFISLYPLKNFSFTIGESIVYSDKLEYSYLIPIMFFRLADHYLSTGDTGDNAQLFFDGSYRMPSISTSIYGSLYVDEFRDVFKDESQGGITVGYTLGLHKTDPFIKNSELILEYTRVNPFAYMNFNPAQTYTSNGYQLGHWIGSNADQIYMNYNQGILRGLYFSVFGEFIRKGQKEDPDAQYVFPYPDFLYGEKNYFRNYGCELKYQITHNLFAQTTFSYSSWSGKAASEFLDNRRGVYSFSLFYGL